MDFVTGNQVNYCASTAGNFLAFSEKIAKQVIFRVVYHGKQDAEANLPLMG